EPVLFVHADRTLLQGDRTLEFTQLGVADTCVVQGLGVDPEWLEVSEREHALEHRQRLVETVAHDAAHAKVVGPKRLGVLSADGRGGGNHAFENGFGLLPLPESKAKLAAEDVEIELHVAGG